MTKPGDPQLVMYESTLRKIWIPEDTSDFLREFLHEFDARWQAYCEGTDDHLNKHVSHPKFMSICNSVLIITEQRRNASRIDHKVANHHLAELAGDMHYLQALRSGLQTQVRKIRQTIAKAFDNDNEEGRKLQYQLRESKDIYREHLDRYEQVVSNILQLVGTIR
jgi:type IV secretory pathway VirB4 component